MSLKLYDSADVISRKGGGGKKSGARYPAYTKGVTKVLDFLNGAIEESKDGYARVKLADLAAEAGMKMKTVVEGKAVDNAPGLHPTSVGWGFKYALFNAGIYATSAKVGDGQPILVMRKKQEGDELPKSLQDKNATGAVTEESETGEPGEEENQ